MSIDAINWAFQINDITSSEKFVLVAFANRANEKHEAWPSWSRLISDTNFDRKTIYYNLKSLQKKGYLIKTGDIKKQVPVYKLCGVLSKEDLLKLKAIKKLSTTRSENGTGCKKGTSSKNGTGTSSKNGTGTRSENGTQNHQLNPKRNPKADLIFLPIKNQIQNQLTKHGLEVTEDIVAQIEFYVDTKPEQPEDQTIRVAVNLHKKKQWKIPSGYLGITSQSIAQRDHEHARNQEALQQHDAKIVRDIKDQIKKRAVIPEPIVDDREHKVIPILSPVGKSSLRDLMRSLKPSYGQKSHD